MRGSPVKEWIVFSILWFLMLLPVLMLTGRNSRSQLSSVQQESGSDALNIVETTMVIRYTGTPVFFRVLQHSALLYEVTNPPPGGTECRLPLQFEDSGTEINLQAEWPDDQEHVVAIALIVDNLAERELHCWARQKLDEVVLFDWQ